MVVTENPKMTIRVTTTRVEMETACCFFCWPAMSPKWNVEEGIEDALKAASRSKLPDEVAAVAALLTGISSSNRIIKPLELVLCLNGIRSNPL